MTGKKIQLNVEDVEHIIEQYDRINQFNIDDIEWYYNGQSICSLNTEFCKKQRLRITDFIRHDLLCLYYEDLEE